MREIGTIAEEKAATVLGDYLLTLGIATKVTPAPEGHRVWVIREEKVDEARGVLEAFRQEPDDPKYREAGQDARAIRKKEQKKEEDFRGKVRRVSDRWNGPFHKRAPLMTALLVISIVVGLATNLGSSNRALIDKLMFSTRSIGFVEGKRVVEDHGFANIEKGEVWRVVTPIFLHFGPLHLLFNMSWLVSLGGGIEMRKGWKKLAVMVLVAAVVGNVGQFFESGGGFGGMSGVVYALFGYVWAKGHSDPGDGFSASPNTVILMVAWFLYGVVSQAEVTQGVPLPRFNMGNVAHGAGLAVGVVFGLLKF